MIIEGIEVENKKTPFTITAMFPGLAKLRSYDAEGYKFSYMGAGWFVHEWQFAPGVWIVTEETSGFRIAVGPTKKEAIKNFLCRIEAYGRSKKRKVRRAINLALSIREEGTIAAYNKAVRISE